MKPVLVYCQPNLQDGPVQTWWADNPESLTNWYDGDIPAMTEIIKYALERGAELISANNFRARNSVESSRATLDKYLENME